MSGLMFRDRVRGESLAGQQADTHDRSQGRGDRARQGVGRRLPREHFALRPCEKIEQRQDQHVHQAAAQEIADGQIGISLPNGRDVDGQFGQRRRPGQQHAADHQPAESRQFGNRVGKLRQKRPGDDDHRRAHEKLQAGVLSCARHPPGERAANGTRTAAPCYPAGPSSSANQRRTRESAIGRRPPSRSLPRAAAGLRPG